MIRKLFFAALAIVSALVIGVMVFEQSAIAQPLSNPSFHQSKSILADSLGPSRPADTTTPTAIFTDTPTNTPTSTPIDTSTDTPTNTPTNTQTSTPTIISTPYCGPTSNYVIQQTSDATM